MSAVRLEPWVLAALALTACGRQDQPPSAAASPSSPSSTDSLVLSAPHGVELWFTASRPAADSAGTPCVERALEIRRDGRRIPIPLLYTGAPPVLANDSTVRARLWLHCRAGDSYSVNLRTGQPTRLR